MDRTREEESDGEDGYYDQAGADSDDPGSPGAGFLPVTQDDLLRVCLQSTGEGPLSGRNQATNQHSLEPGSRRVQFGVLPRGVT